MGFSNSSLGVKADIANPARLAETANTKGATRVNALCGLLRRSGRDNPQATGLSVAAARSHQAHPDEMARTTANVLGNNRIVMPWALRIYPGPACRSESSKLPSSVKVNGFLLLFQNGAQCRTLNVGCELQ